MTLFWVARTKAGAGVGSELSVSEPVPHAGRRYELVVADTWDAIERLLPEWRDLYEHSTAASQCSAPDLLLAWARMHSRTVPQVVGVRHGPELVAAAAFSVRRVAGVRILSLLGTGPNAQIIELPEIITRAGIPSRKPVGLILSWASAPERRVHWAAICVGDGQNWPEGTWAHPTRSLLKTTKASVVLPMVPGDWTGPLPRVKRNLRESLRRARNRLNRTGLPWRVEVTDDLQPGYQGAFADLRELHRQRSLLSGPRHPDVLAHAESVVLLDGLAGVSPSTRLEIRRLMLGERPIAALLTLRDRTGLWISISGISAEGWQFSAITVLQADAIATAARDGLPKATFSVGVDDSKLRWSEEIRRTHEFVLVQAGPVSGAAFAAYWLGRAVFQLRERRSV